MTRLTDEQKRELRVGRVCLVSKSGENLNCHEYTPICDCTVLALLDELEDARQVILAAEDMIKWPYQPGAAKGLIQALAAYRKGRA